MRNKRIKSARKRLSFFQQYPKERHVSKFNDDLNRFQMSFKQSSKSKPSLLVDNWKSGWKWFSSWAFALIIFFATMPVPKEILAILPEDKKNLLLAFLAFWGLVFRFINQSSLSQQPKEQDDGQHR